MTGAVLGIGNSKACNPCPENPDLGGSQSCKLIIALQCIEYTVGVT